MTRCCEPERRQEVQASWLRSAVDHAHADDQVGRGGPWRTRPRPRSSGLRKDARINQLVFGLVLAAAPVFLDQVGIRKGALRIPVLGPHVRVGRGAVQKQPREDVKKPTSTWTAPRPTRTCGPSTGIRSAPFRIPTWSRKTGAAARTSPNTSWLIRASLPKTATSRSGRVRQGHPDRPDHPRERDQPRTGASSLAPPADALVSQHLGHGALRLQPDQPCTQTAPGTIQAIHADLGSYWLICQDAPELLFTENETNAQRLWGVPNRTPYVKDSIHDYIVAGAEGRTTERTWAPKPRRIT